jgi:hypothetical protein
MIPTQITHTSKINVIFMQHWFSHALLFSGAGIQRNLSCRANPADTEG